VNPVDRTPPAGRHCLLGANTNTFFTIGHSTRTIDEFVDLLQQSGVDLVVDVRSMPRSRTNPQFNGESLPEALDPWRIGYEPIAELGGLRGKSRAVEPSPNGYWRVRGFRNYADYALTKPFAVGLARLRERGEHNRCVIMCAEAVWWRCHRRIIADYLLGQGERVMHILGPGHVDEASLTPGAIVGGDGRIIYPAEGPQPSRVAPAASGPETIVMALPPDARPYRRTDTFTEATVPAGLLKAHKTKPDVWALIHVLEGRLAYKISKPGQPPSNEVLTPGTPAGVIEPAIPHEVEPLGPVRFYVEFYRRGEA